MLFSVCFGLLALPALIAYTHAFGTEVALRVDGCERGPRYGYECHGSWTGSDGTRHSTTVSHVGPGDVGRTVKARLGPWGMGAHAGSIWNESPLFIPVVVLAFGLPGYLLLRWRFDREVKDAARRLLEAPEHFLVLEVNRDGSTRPDGEAHLRLRFGDPDMTVPAGADRRRFASVRRPDGGVAFLTERCADQLLVRDEDGRTETVIPQLTLQSGRPRIERPDGTLLGELTLTRGHTGDVHSVVDPDGKEVGRFARLRRGTWTLCLSPDCSPTLANAVLAYLFIEGRAA